MNNAGKNSNGVKKPPVLHLADIITPCRSNFILQSQNHNNSSPQEHKSKSADNFDIPKFDIAEQVLANQRRLSAMKRKPPSSKTPIQAEQTANAFNKVDFRPQIYEQTGFTVIKEIVTRDIETLFRV